jgi:multiple antibiotic resistance protein
MILKELLSVTLILFSIIDIVGNIPILLSLKEKGLVITPGRATLASGIIMILFLFLGESILHLFGVDLQSFAVAGGIVIFIIGLEMILGIHLMKADENVKTGSVFPVAFPLIAGAGTLTTILSIKAEFEMINILGGILINLLCIYFVIRSSDFIQAQIGKGGTEMLRKIFGIILLAIAIKLIKSNFQLL